MKSVPFESLRLAKIQVATTLTLLACFVAGSIALVIQSQQLDSEIFDIAGNAMPSVVNLSRARGDLRAMEVVLQREVETPGVRAEPDSLPALYQSFVASLASYAALPFFPGERQLFAEADLAKAEFERDSMAARAAADAGDRAAAQSALHRAMRASGELDTLLQHIVVINAEQGERVGLHLTALRREIVMRTMLVDGMVSLLAGAGTLIAILMWRRSTRAIQERSSELDLFAGRVAHDLLSPLNAVTLGLKAAEAHVGDEPAGIRVLERSTRAVARVRDLVTGLLEFARAGAPLSAGPGADVDETIRGVIDCVEAEAAGAGIELSVSAESHFRVACSPGVLSSLVQNLVRNAVKYIGETPTKRVHVGVRCHGRYVRVQVDDNGPGVPADMQEKVFEPFVRGTSALPGAGLGLATVKKLVEAHHGSVGCKSAGGAGSTFWFELPRCPDAPAGSAPL
jgi:signal transduction histidine kinase